MDSPEPLSHTQRNNFSIRLTSMDGWIPKAPMAENSSAAGREAFEESLLECIQDINDILPGLRSRYDTMAIISALAEHVGSALRVLIRKKICDAGQARLAIRHIENSVFPSKPSCAASSDLEGDDKGGRRRDN